MHKHLDPIAPLVKCLMKGKLEIICDNIMRLGLMMCYWIRWDNGRCIDEVCNEPTHKWITNGINTFWICASHHVRIFSLRPGDSVSFRDENFNPFHTKLITFSISWMHVDWMRKDLKCGGEMCGIKRRQWIIMNACIHCNEFRKNCFLPRTTKATMNCT